MESTPSQQQAAPEQPQNGSAGTRSQGFPATKIGVFVVVATIIAAGAFFGTQAFLLDDDAADDNRRAVAVQSGTLLDEVTASGSVEFPELESMRFDISGNVGEILVAEQNDPESLRAVIQKLGGEAPEGASTKELQDILASLSASAKPSDK